MKISNTKLGYCLSMTRLRVLVFFLLLFSLGSIAQNKIAGDYRWRRKKLTTVEVYNKTPTSKYLPMLLALLNLI
jgi:Fe(3+) dicitrate transport protein